MGRELGVVAAAALAASAAGQECAWVAAPQGGAPERAGHAMAYDSGRARVVVFGGWGCCPAWSGETWEWDGQAWSLRATAGPSPRNGSVMVYDAARGECVLFGGFHPGATTPVYHADTWLWDGTAWVQRVVVGPPARTAAAMAYDALRSRAVLYGGYVSPGPTEGLGDTWEWDGASWTQRSPAATPGPRHNHAMAYDGWRSQTVLHGGATGDTWAWNGTEWSLLPTSGPVRRGHRMVFDGARGRLVFTAGYDANWMFAQGGWWEWTPAAWVQQGAAAPIGIGAGLVFDSGRGRAVFFGGDTSEFTAPPSSATLELACGCYANCDGSTLAPVLNVNDFICFQTRFAAGDPYANCDGSTGPPVLKLVDFLCFANRFAAGCP